jgi:hypothetical protein
MQFAALFGLADLRAGTSVHSLPFVEGGSTQSAHPR